MMKRLRRCFDLCLGCKACATRCPSNVDMATAKIELMYQWQTANGASKDKLVFGKKAVPTTKKLHDTLGLSIFFHNGIASYLIKNIVA